MELLVHLDRLNYHEAWIGEHHSGGYEIIACPEMFIAAAAERTRHIRLGTGVVSLPYHNPFTVAGRMMQLDYMTRGRAMFGVGPGSLVYDAIKMGLKAEDQRRKLDESLDVIMELMQGGAVTKKTDWFDLHEARLQFKSYSQPMMEMAVASARSPTGALSAGKHGIGMLVDRRHLGRRAQGARQQLGRLRGERAGARQDTRSQEVAHRHLRARGGDPRAGARRHDIRPRRLQALFRRSGDLPHRAARHHQRPRRISGVFGYCLHRHAGRLHPPFRAAVARLERRLRRRALARAQLGRLAGDQKKLRADGALRPSALPAQRKRTAAMELRRRQGEIRHRRRSVARRGAGGDRQASGAEGADARAISPAENGWF